MTGKSEVSFPVADKPESDFLRHCTTLINAGFLANEFWKSELGSSYR